MNRMESKIEIANDVNIQSIKKVPRKQEILIKKAVEEEVKEQLQKFNVYDLKQTFDSLEKELTLNVQKMFENAEFVQNFKRQIINMIQQEKELSYSIDAEIRHVLMHAPISSNVVCKTKIMEVIKRNEIEIEHSNMPMIGAMEE